MFIFIEIVNPIGNSKKGNTVEPPPAVSPTGTLTPHCHAMAHQVAVPCATVW